MKKKNGERENIMTEKRKYYTSNEREEEKKIQSNLFDATNNFKAWEKLYCLTMPKFYASKPLLLQEKKYKCKQIIVNQDN